MEHTLKTANIALSNAYEIVEGIAVDNHVRRRARKLGLTEHVDPYKIEEDLMKIVPKDYWMKITDLLIFHGRRVCEARKPKCVICILNRICPSAFKFD
jgi:endonuclease-3